MPRKTLQVQVELDIQAITCPGVWLCPNGKISLQLSLLDSTIQTTSLQPVFPLLYHEKFIFYKAFNSAHSLSDLQRYLAQESLYAELIQWQDYENGSVLSTFQTSLVDVLYPTSYEGSIAGVDVDLLMEPSKNFPGIIAPKIEISTRTTVEEIVCSCIGKKCNSFVINPKTVPSEQYPCGRKRNQVHQQKVCHSFGYHKARRCMRAKKSNHNKPPFLFRKVKEELLSRKPQGLEERRVEKCRFCRFSSNLDTWNRKNNQASPTEISYSKLTEEFLNNYPKLQRSKSKSRSRCSNKKLPSCACGSGHSQENCTVCSKYNCYFEEKCPCLRPSTRNVIKCKPVSDNFPRKVPAACSPTRKDKQTHRSPIRSSGKNCCCCSSRKGDSGCDCSTTSNECKSAKKMCAYALRKKPSLVERMHQRLNETLDCTPVYPFADVQCGGDADNDLQLECVCPKFRNCREGFYKNLGKFYRDLRRC